MLDWVFTDIGPADGHHLSVEIEWDEPSTQLLRKSLAIRLGSKDKVNLPRFTPNDGLSPDTPEVRMILWFLWHVLSEMDHI